MQKITIQNQEAQLLPMVSLLKQIPNDSTFKQYFANHHDDKGMALYFEGNTILDTIDLDNPFGRLDADWTERYSKALDENDDTEKQRLSDEYDQQLIRLILVKGDLFVTRFIFNDETDGASGLIVLGNLQCPNIIVGGQEIYVQQNLVVDEVYWGDYNHGELMVKGNMTAAVLIQTDYNVTVSGFKRIDTHLDEYDFEWSGILLSDLFDEETLDQPAGSLGEQLSKYSMQQQLLKGLPIIKKQIKTPLFTTYELSIENLRKLSHFNIIGLNDFEYQVEDVELTVTRAYTDEDGKSWNDALRLKQDEQEVFICVERVEIAGKESILGKLFAKPKPNYHEQLVILWKAPDLQWYYVDKDTPIAVQNLLQLFWPQALLAAERMEQLSTEEIQAYKTAVETEITIEKIEYYLNLPIVLKCYNDYYDGDKNGYWSSNIYFAFRQNNSELTDRIQLVESRQFTELKYFPSVTAEDGDARGYQFDIRDDLSGNKIVEVRYLPHDGRGAYPLTPLDVVHYQKALNLWRYFEKHFPHHNTQFERGSWDENDPNAYLSNDDDQENELHISTAKTEMNQELEQLINQLEQYIQKAHQSGNKYDFIDSAYPLVEVLETLEHPLVVVEAILKLIERSPDIDYGGPGPLGSFMESFYHKGYEEKLVESVNRKPTVCTLHLLERMINDPEDPNRPAYLSLMMSIAIYSTHPKHIQNEAKDNLVYLIENLQTDDSTLIAQLAVAKKLLETSADDYAEKQKKLQNNQPSVVTVNYHGISFKVINRQQAQTLLPNITDMVGLEKLYNINDEWRFPMYDEGGFFLLAEENVVTETFEMDYSVPGVDELTVLGFIFLKDLHVQSHILAFDTDNSPILVVFGDVQCPHIHLFGNIHYLGGHVTTQLLWAKYNHGELYLNGSIDAKVILADDMNVFIRKLGHVKALISIMGMNIYLKKEQGDEWEQTGSTHELQDIFLPEVLVTTTYGEIELNEAGENSAIQRLKQNKSLLI